MSQAIILLVGPSGSGKTAVANYLAHMHGLKPISSYTTRPPRSVYESGHIFLSEGEFSKLSNLVAYTKYNGHQYGVTADQIDQNDVYIVDVDGALTLANRYLGDKRFIVGFLDVSAVTCMKRMGARGDSGLMIASRLFNDISAFDKSIEKLKESYDNIFIFHDEDSVAAIGEALYTVFQEEGGGLHES